MEGLPDLHTTLVMLHVVGTILGVGGATLAEVFVLKALKDGKVDASEKQLMHANYTTIRVGMALVLLSGLALVWWWLAEGGSDWVITSGKILAKDTIFALIVVNAVLLTKHWIPLWLGAAVSFTGWWAATILGLWQRTPYSYWEIMVGFVISVGVVAIILEGIKKWYLRK